MKHYIRYMTVGVLGRRRASDGRRGVVAMEKTMWNRALAVVMSVVMAVSLTPLPASALVTAGSAGLTGQALSVRAPRVVADSSMVSGQKATWDCVWFGSYPQEVVKDAATIAALDKASWSGDRASVGGVVYARLYEGDTTSSDYFSDFSSYYGNGGCLYFKCSPIKWRVLETDGSTALLLADQALDDQRYNSVYAYVTWETCTLRSWLNSSFKDAAFTSAEKAAILRQVLANEDNPKYGTAGGDATSDDIFLLSNDDVAGTLALANGFAADEYYTVYSWSDCSDEGRCAYVSDFAHAMGGHRNTYHSSQPDSGDWWLRSPGNGAFRASGVDSRGMASRFGLYVSRHGDDDSSDYAVVRPALRVSLTANQISYAGTVCSDGTAAEVGGDAPAPISGAAITLGAKSYTYDGKAKRPSVTVKLGDATLKEGTDYTVSYSANVNAGTAKATVTGKGNYTGTASATFSIGKAANAVSVSTAAVVKTGSVSKATTFTRAAKAASGAVKYASNSKCVTVSKAGKVTVRANWTGAAKVTVSSPASANYKAAAPKSYAVKVKPGKMAVKKAANVKGAKAKVTWAKMAGADRYQVRVALDAKFAKGKKTYSAAASLASKTTGKLAKGKVYYVQVRAYDKQTNAWGAWSAAKKVKIGK